MSEASWQTRSRVRLLVAALTACIACAVVAAATAGDGGGTVATDLQNPRGIAAGPGKQLLVVESATGAVDVVRHGRTRTIATVPARSMWRRTSTARTSSSGTRAGCAAAAGGIHLGKPGPPRT